MIFRSAILSVPATLAALAFLASCGVEDPVVTNSGGATTTGGSAQGGSAAGGSAGAAGAASSAGTTSSAGAGLGGSTGGGGASAGAAATASFGTLKNIIQMSCFGGVCHDLPEHPLQLKVDDKLYATLTTHQTKGCGPLLKPGSPQDSALVKLLKGPCGEIARMPLDKCFQDGDEACVTPANIALIEQWIAAGAPP